MEANRMEKRDTFKVRVKLCQTYFCGYTREAFRTAVVHILCTMKACCYDIDCTLSRDNQNDFTNFPQYCPWFEKQAEVLRVVSKQVAFTFQAIERQRNENAKGKAI